MKKGATERFLKLGSSIIKAGGHLVKSEFDRRKKDLLVKVEGTLEDAQILGKKLEAAKEIVQVMGELKGAVMKLGQILSSSGDLILPPDISNLFRELQKNAPPMKWDEIEKVLNTGLGNKTNTIFKEIDPGPMASASIGQVHRARLLNGEDVAIKIQYPDVVAAIKSDFKNLHILKSILMKLLPYDVDVDPILVNLRTSILAECDYLSEARNADMFHSTYAKKYPYMLFPKIITHASSSTVLTMQLVEGDSLEETMQRSQLEKDEMGRKLYDFHLDCCYTTGLLHGDPQNGNYLFKKDQIILLDFGNIQKLSLDFRKNYVGFLRAIENGDLRAYQQYGINLGVLTMQDDQDFLAKHFSLASSIFSPFDQVGIFPPPLDNPLQLIHQFVKGIKLKGTHRPCGELAVIDRTHLGLYTKLRAWNSHLDWKGPKDRILGEFENNLQSGTLPQFA
ncbi:MAG: AarF/ABC1/UbiB kinase family protein [Bdellovibrio sp.]|nr:AarF/ABC1/UbiB kinase family protein [Bdellovibrio sp.]